MHNKPVAIICVVSIGAWLCHVCAALAYFDDYPPYRFAESAPKHINASALVDLTKSEFRSPDGSVFVSLKEKDWTPDFVLKEGDKTLLEQHNEPFPYAVYWVDIDGNGLKDFIVLYNYRGCGLAATQDKVDMLLKKPDGSYVKISYDTMSSGINDFVDLDKDGKWEVLITDMYEGNKHNYFSYSVYEFENYRLVNVDHKIKGFPKFIWYTHRPNDKNAVGLTEKEKACHVAVKNKFIAVCDLS